MSKNDKPAEAAQFDDDDEIDAGASYDEHDPFKVEGGSKEFHYYLAAKDGDKSRPDGVARVKAMGYEVCKDETCESTDCTLMRIPMKKFSARRRGKQEARKKARTAALRPQGIPEASLKELEGHGQTQRRK